MGVVDWIWIICFEVRSGWRVVYNPQYCQRGILLCSFILSFWFEQGFLWSGWIYSVAFLTVSEIYIISASFFRGVWFMRSTFYTLVFLIKPLSKVRISGNWDVLFHFCYRVSIFFFSGWDFRLLKVCLHMFVFMVWLNFLIVILSASIEFFKIQFYSYKWA